MKDILEYFGIDPEDPDCGVKMYAASLELVAELMKPFTGMEESVEDLSSLGLNEDASTEFMVAISIVVTQELTQDKFKLLTLASSLSQEMFGQLRDTMMEQLIQKIVLMYVGVRYKQTHSFNESDLPNLDFLKGDD